MSYSVGFTSKSVKIREKEGLSIKQTAQRFHLGTASITRWLKRIEPAPCSSRRRKIDKEAFIKQAEQYPDADAVSTRPGGSFRGADVKKMGALTYKKALRHPEADKEARLLFQDKIVGHQKQGKSLLYR
ncbi:IS630 transposase-related protein [Candidatus Williamhamiltonella defendens]|uniref:IS630 transposase-related protein n=1 Tax=Candidatus Williamhamiltonella defendens TaxID=138072 RepID=UPI001581523D|nr:IS630 transposase-related protein [Candidatus Hamiltonella defensa]